MNQFVANRVSAHAVRRQRLLTREFGHLSTLVTRDLKNSENGVRRVGFCAGNPGEGCTSIATNYAVFCGQQGVRTTLIEADLQRPSLADFFGVDESPGLWEILEGTADMDEVVHEQVSKGVNLMTAGVVPRDVLVAGENFDLAPVFDYLAPHNDLIVVDVPALASSPEANLLLPQMDGVVLVVQANRSRLCAIERSILHLDKLGVNLLGSVMNKIRYEVPTVVDRLL